MDKLNRRKLTSVVSGYVLNIAILYVAFVVAFVTSKLIRLPSRNPYEISNLFLTAGFTPEINFVRIVWMIIAGAATYLGLILVLKKHPTLFRVMIALVITGGIFGSSIMPKIDGYIGHIDTFHHGEQLSPGKAFQQGKHLYTDMFVLHGAGEDVIIPYTAFHIPGTPKDGGIGSYFFLTATLQVISVFIFILFLARYLRSTALFVATSFWFAFSAYSNFYYARDIFVWGSLVLIWYVFHSDIKGRLRYLLLTVIGFIASGSLFYSIDRGIISMFIALCLATVLLATEPIGYSLQRKLCLPKKLSRWIDPIIVGFGVLIAQALLAILLGAGQYVEFLKTTFGNIPKYQGLMFNYPLPEATESTYALWLPIFLAILGVLMLGYLLVEEFKKKMFSADTMLLLILLSTAILFLRIGYGRSDWGHIAYSTPLLFATLFILSHVFWTRKIEHDVSALWMPLLFSILLFAPVNSVTAASLTVFPSSNPRVLVDYLKLPSRSDNIWIPTDVAQVTEYIKAHSKNSDSIFVFTQQPIYYYLTQRKNPTRFYISWFADPKPLTEEMLTDLKRNPPKIIVYSSGSGWDNPDGYFMSDRAPEVDAWIRTNYTKEVKIGPITLLTP